MSRLLLYLFKQKLGPDNGIFEEVALDGVLCVEVSATSVAQLTEGCVHTEAHAQTICSLQSIQYCDSPWVLFFTGATKYLNVDST